MLRRRVALFAVVAMAASMVTIASGAAGAAPTKTLLPGNPKCATLNALDEAFPGVTEDWGFKVNQSPNGTFTLAPSGGTLEGGAPADASKTITISNSNGFTFDWSSNFGIDAVIVKGGDNANVYYYSPESTGGVPDGVGLASPNNNSGNQAAISHIEFCFDDVDDPQPPQERGHIDIEKFYDANANGLNDAGDHPIAGWEVTVSPTPGQLFTPASIDVDPGNYQVDESTPVEPNWIHTGSLLDGSPQASDTTVGPFAVTAGQTRLVEFGNICVGANGGGHTLGFWSNKNGQATLNDDGGVGSELALLSSKNLKNEDGTDFNPTTYAQLRTWLLNARAVNMAYMLSAQLAAMVLNVEEGFVNPNALIFAPGTSAGAATGFATVQQIIDEANAALGADGSTPSGDPNRAIQEALKNALDAANNNQNFAHPNAAACPFTFQSQTTAAATTLQAASSDGLKKARRAHRRGGRGNGRRR